jgi:hypothetical protein
MYSCPNSTRNTHTERVSFYSMSENELWRMARGHYGGSKGCPSGFSSWAASLHVVLCYAKSLEYAGKAGTHVAVMDTHDVDDEVLVWHVSHLMAGGNHEYLAFGIIRGTGYRTVSLHDLEQHGLLNVVPEIKNYSHTTGFGHALRMRMFSKETASMEVPELDLIKTISLLFGNLSFPVATALTCLRPRIWRGWQDSRLDWTDPQRDIDMLAKYLNITSTPAGLLQEPWLVLHNVDTCRFPDVAQWIVFVAMIAERVPHQPEHQLQELQPLLDETTSKDSHETKTKNKKRARDNDEEQEPPTKRQLRPTTKIIYKECKGTTCGECISCVKQKKLHDQGLA